jgi:hypothetical protein
MNIQCLRAHRLTPFLFLLQLTPPRSSANAHVRVQQRLPQAEAAHCKFRA